MPDKMADDIWREFLDMEPAFLRARDLVDALRLGVLGLSLAEAGSLETLGDVALNEVCAVHEKWRAIHAKMVVGAPPPLAAVPKEQAP